MSASEATDEESPLVTVAVGAALLVGFGVAATLYALGVGVWWIGFPMIGGLVPLAVGLARHYGERESPENDGAGARQDETADALERVRERYANGELSEAEFERRLERLLETETVEEARQSLDRDRSVATERDPVRETE